MQKVLADCARLLRAQSGLLRDVHNLGVDRLPWRMRAHGEYFDIARFVLPLLLPPTAAASTVVIDRAAADAARRAGHHG